MNDDNQTETKIGVPDDTVSTSEEAKPEVTTHTIKADLKQAKLDAESLGIDIFDLLKDVKAETEAELTGKPDAETDE